MLGIDVGPLSDMSELEDLVDFNIFDTHLSLWTSKHGVDQENTEGSKKCSCFDENLSPVFCFIHLFLLNSQYPLSRSLRTWIKI